MTFMGTVWDAFVFVFWIFLLVAYLIVLFSIITDLFRDRATSWIVKAIWVVFLLFFPFVTALVYLIARGGGTAERSQAQMQQARSETDAYIKSVAATSPAEEIAKAKAKPCSTRERSPSPSSMA